MESENHILLGNRIFVIPKLIFPALLKKITLLLLLCSVLGFSQELPPILKFSSQNYGAGNQNWMISQDENQYVYFANNEGLLEFNGANWQLYPSPNETIIRSVKSIDDRIYTGCYMEFGYWKRQENGILKYYSLSKSIKNKLVDDEQIWNIIDFDQWVVFQSLNQIFLYDTKTEKFKIISAKSSINRAFKANSSIYFQTYGEGLFEIENGVGKLISNDAVIMKNKIVNIFSKDGSLLVQTQFNGFFNINNGIISKWHIEADAELAVGNIYSSQILSDGSFAVGTVSNGIFLLSKEGKVVYHITQNKGLSNNTALSIFEDVDKNLWIGLDNGINCINLKSPVRSFADDTGILGTVYTSILHNGNLYVGTNQGLFYKKYGSSEDFKFIRDTKGQVWSLFSHDGTLFCGHDSGTYIINENSVNHLFATSGTWKFENVPGKSNFLLQGNYYGISVLEKVNNQWIFRNKISGFDYSSKYFEITNSNEIYVSHEYKGVFRFQLDKEFRTTRGFETYKSPMKGKNAGLTKFNNNIYYSYKEGIFKLNLKTKKFEKDSILSKVFEKDSYTSGKLMVDNSNRLWFFTKNYINYFSFGKLSSQLKHNIIPIPSSLTNSMLGYENITQLSNSLYLIGTTDGYYTINLDDLDFNTYKISMSTITVNRSNENIRYASILNASEFKFAENNITFTYTVPEFNKYINAEYQFLLEGFQDEWSEWSTKPTINFKNLSPGDYVFKVRAKIGNTLSENTISYSFTILKPWYQTNIAIFIYLIIFIVIAYFVNRTYKNYYQSQNEKLIEENNRLLEIKELETEQQLMKIKNQQLEQDFESKNRELAASTMSLIKKNELLTEIKEDLKRNSEAGNTNVKSVISTINKNISEEDTWNIFKDAFNNADKDFLKKVKNLHSSLTPNDLRLCAYLRLNLSSKEIAPLLNISVRSVEIKRYRLRKKMDLSHEQGLVEYILSI